MGDLLSNVDLDPLASPVGLVVVLVAVRMVLAAVRTVFKIAAVIVILVGVYIFFYGGNLPFAVS